ncbi:hypothetical protein FQN54_009922 [Arachnomyces sp. PD_36]|nr:hypothetical protein FQN54_009922 [Arachnomyces sp. PD_36]
MTGLAHTYGPSCLLYDGPHNTAEQPTSTSSTTPPRVRAQYFYISPLPIDDPLTPLPQPSAGSNSTNAKLPPQPFSGKDNIALEEAWRKLREEREAHERLNGEGVLAGESVSLPVHGSRPTGLGSQRKSEDTFQDEVEKLAEEALTAARALRILSKHTSRDIPEDERDVQSVLDAVKERAGKSKNKVTSPEQERRFTLETLREVISRIKGDIYGKDVRPDIKAIIEVVVKITQTSRLSHDEPRTSETAERSQPVSVPLDQDENRRQSRVLGRASKDSPGTAGTYSPSTTDPNRVRFTPELADSRRNSEERERARHRKRHSSPSDRKAKTPKRRVTSSPSGEEEWDTGESGRGTPVQAAPSTMDTNISGSPFIRAPSRHKGQSSISVSPKIPEPSTPTRSRNLTENENPRASLGTPPNIEPLERPPPTADSEERPSSKATGTSDQDEDAPQSLVTVGVSRLHLVELPSLKMKPIYWSPIHDISPVVRATWFYKNTMYPVEPDLANQLEAGYVYLRPWSETWQDELNSCVENGAEAELKIVHKLWPNEYSKATNRSWIGQDPKAAAAASAEAADSESDKRPPLTFEDNQAAGADSIPTSSTKPFISSSVIYVNSKEAQILRPSLLPSASRGRKPLGPIRKGRQIGIAVVRGFNRQAWDKLHPPKQSPVDVRNYMRQQQSRDAGGPGRRQMCYGCDMEERRPSATDLVLVIHGIGQKLSERMESFHFTHAINAFRRQVNIELNSDAVWPHIRPDLGGIMVLPINWRSKFSPDDGEPASTPGENHFGLKDITPETLPAVRNLISDVMLDIPYYLSHHKRKMIQTVVKEANRVYRLWCENNPGFQEHGRVHLIAHSLGSVMALDILSQQPTHLPHMNFATTEIHSDIFEFDTKGVFFCGSPAGFFLLLNKANLLPRKGRDKPGREGEDRERGVAGEAGTYGCLAIDNLYNIVHYNDAIAYRLNAAVDSGLANSLKPASVPSSSTTFFQAVGNVFRWSSTPPSSNIAALAPITTPAPDPSQPPAHISKLPSTIEMDTHDFTHEEIAEKRMGLLNDNGQIDFYLSSGGGPLNIQYLNMLGAHSSYWILQDFVRFLVVEIGRRPGKEGTLVALRAEKKKGWKKGK